MNEMSPLPPEIADYDAILKELAERSYREFVYQAWSQLETGVLQKNWHIDCISEHLEAMVSRELEGILVINIPFRMMKSLLVNVFLQPWVWTLNPDPGNTEHGLPCRPGTYMGAGCKFLVSSHSEPIATRDSRRARNLIQSPWYQRRWGGRFEMRRDQNAKDRYENDRGGYRISGARGSELGDGGDLCIADDPVTRGDVNSPKILPQTHEWWDQDFSTRANDQDKPSLIVIQQRLHLQDTSGHVLTNADGVTHLMLPMEYEPKRCCYSPVKTSISSDEPIQAQYHRETQSWIPEGQDVEEAVRQEIETRPIETVYKQDIRTEEGELLWPSRVGRKAVDRMKISLGSYGRAGQYQQRPAPREGNLFERHWFQIINNVPNGTKWARGWDLAASVPKPGSTPAASCGVLIGEMPDGGYVIAHEVRLFGKPHAVERAIYNTAEQDLASIGPHILSIPQDPGQAGVAQKDHYLKLLAKFNIRFSPESGDKVSRADPLSAQAEAGNVYLFRGAWNKAFLDEVCLFPSTALKDRVDAASRAYMELAGKAPDFEWYIGGD